MASGQLTGKRVLVVEDELLIAMDLADSLAAAGAEVVGPCHSLEDAKSAAADEGIDAAILDVDLGGREVFPAADILVRRGIPFLFHSGRLDRAQLDSAFSRAPICPKPMAAEQLIETVRSLVAVAA
ncbi:response regulator [Pelagibacterium lacus]|uniref:Response regulator n=1 Tax=Pelagibacterium lacus TaxID=2282655 RepID=A0A369W0E1_9HYPH|nr:response regulator [Pelagibacterium lacus]RDE08018.1 response regulator [Pelagibacterium lacus]